MYSSHLHSHLCQANVDDLRRQALTRQGVAAGHGGAIRQDSAPLSVYLKRAIGRLGVRAADGATANL